MMKMMAPKQVEPAVAQPVNQKEGLEVRKPPETHLAKEVLHLEAVDTEAFIILIMVQEVDLAILEELLHEMVKTPILKQVKIMGLVKLELHLLKLEF